MKDKGKETGTRLAAMILDHFIMSFGATFAGLLVAGLVILLLYLTTDITSENNVFIIIMITVLATTYPVYFNKDSIGGRSPAKRILKIMVIDLKTGIAASPVKTVLRNFTLIIWPIEVLVVLFSPERRLGDRIAGTQVVGFDESLQRRSSAKEVLLAFLVALIFMIPLVWIVVSLGAFGV